MLEEETKFSFIHCCFRREGKLDEMEQCVERVQMSFEMQLAKYIDR